MSSVRLYKQKFNAEDGWYVSDETSEYEGRTLMSLVVGEVVYGSNKKPLSIPIYEEILNSLINQTDRFIIDCGNKDHQLTIIDNGVLVEYSPQKKEQYDKVREELTKYSLPQKIRAYHSINESFIYDRELDKETLSLIGDINARLGESHRRIVFKYLLLENIKSALEEMQSLSTNERDFSEYLSAIDKDELIIYLKYSLLIKAGIKVKDEDFKDIMQGFSISKKYFVQAVEGELVERYYKGLCILK